MRPHSVVYVVNLLVIRRLRGVRPSQVTSLRNRLKGSYYIYLVITHLQPPVNIGRGFLNHYCSPVFCHQLSTSTKGGAAEKRRERKKNKLGRRVKENGGERG